MGTQTQRCFKYYNAAEKREIKNEVEMVYNYIPNMKLKPNHDYYEEYINNSLNKIEKDKLKDIPRRTFACIRSGDEKIIGMINVRASEELLDYPYGHIGYSIRPDERGKGYGKIQFYLGLKLLDSLGISTCEMTCENVNNRSRAVIVDLGGKYFKNIDSEEHYLVDVKDSLKANFDRFEKYVEV